MYLSTKKPSQPTEDWLKPSSFDTPLSVGSNLDGIAELGKFSVGLIRQILSQIHFFGIVLWNSVELIPLLVFPDEIKTKDATEKSCGAQANNAGGETALIGRRLASLEQLGRCNVGSAISNKNLLTKRC